jgi:AraC family transcriptional activator of pobA
MASSSIPPMLGQSISEAVIPDVKTTLNLFGIHSRTVSGAWHYPAHSHPQYEINYVLEGEQEITVNQSQYRQNAGDFALLRPGELHSSRSGNGKPFTYFCIHFDIDDQVFLSLLSRMKHVLFHADSSVVGKVKPALSALVELSSGLALAGAEGMTFAERMRLQAAVFELFGQLWEAFSAEADLQSSISYEKVELANQIQSRLQGMVFQQFKQTDADSADSSFGIADIAAEFGISLSHCNRVFRRVFGISPRVYLSRQMFHEARILLNDPRMSINQISAILGYRDIAHFSRQFKRWSGQAPTAYRRAHAEGPLRDQV